MPELQKIGDISYLTWLMNAIARLEDGDVPVSKETKEVALRLAVLLPQGFEINSDNDGEINFEYHVAKKLSFLFSIGENGMISYAGHKGEESWHGVAKFEDVLPEEIKQGIEKVKGESK
jgi:hypothetical protein